MMTPVHPSAVLSMLSTKKISEYVQKARIENWFEPKINTEIVGGRKKKEQKVVGQQLCKRKAEVEGGR